MPGTYDTGTWRHSYLVSQGQPGFRWSNNHRLMYEERRTNEFFDELRRLKQRVLRLEQLMDMKGAGSF